LAGVPADLPVCLSREVRDGDLVVTIGAGDVTAVGPALIRILREADHG
jgi:UDP-N-acetylmuramate--alanine ligase